MNKRSPLKVPGKMLAVLLMFFQLVQAQSVTDVEADSYTLDQCISYALEHHKTIENARFDAYIAQKKVNEFTGIGLPQVKASAGYSQYLDIPVSVIDIRSFPSDPGSPPIPEGLPDSFYFQTARFGLRHNASIGGDISQLLFDGSFLIGLKAAKQFVSLSEINVERSQEEAAVNVAKAYYNALVNEERARILTTNIDRLSKLLATTEAMYKEGFIEKVDVDRLKIQLNNLQAEMRKVSRMVALGYDLLKFQMGMDINQELLLSDRIENHDKASPLSETAMTGNPADNRVEMRLMESQMGLQEMNVKRNRAGTYGSLVAFGSLQYNTYRPRFFELDIEKNWFRTTVVGLQYNVLLFDGLQKRARISQSKFEISKIRNNMDMFAEFVKLEHRAASSGVTNAYEDVESAKRNLELSNEVYRISTTKYEEGLGTNLEVINAESTLMESQINYLTALYDYTLAQVELRRVKGGFNPSEFTKTETK